MKTPCYDCCSRCKGCHDICEIYKEFRLHKEMISEKMNEERQFADYLSDAIKKYEGNRRRIQIDKDRILEILDEVVKMYFDYNCSVEEVIEWAKEVVKYESRI